MNRKEKLEIRFMGLTLKAENISWKGVLVIGLVLLFFLTLITI